MRFRLILALSVSAALILSAGLVRISHNNASKANLVAVAEAPALVDTLPSSTSTAASDITPPPAEAALSDTDMVTRQLFSNYLNMAYQGQITPDNVDALATSYADSIANLNKATQLNATDLNIVVASQSSLQSYSASLQSIYNKYQGLLTDEFNNAPSAGAITPELSAFSERVGAIYGREANELKSMPVPQTMLADHLALVNNYLRDALDYSSVKSTSANPVDAMAGITMAAKNLNEESTLLSDLQKSLSANGIIISIQ